jgi:hypothetical protein
MLTGVAYCLHSGEVASTSYSIPAKHTVDALGGASKLDLPSALQVSPLAAQSSTPRSSRGSGRGSGRGPAAARCRGEPASRGMEQHAMLQAAL